MPDEKHIRRPSGDGAHPGEGWLALYVYDWTNLTLAKSCLALGYVEYAEEFFSEY